jgi:hypothetical protein
VEALKWKRINTRKSYNHVSAVVSNAGRLIESLPDRKTYTSVYDSSTLDACGGRVQHRQVYLSNAVPPPLTSLKSPLSLSAKYKRSSHGTPPATAAGRALHYPPSVPRRWRDLKKPAPRWISESSAPPSSATSGHGCLRPRSSPSQAPQRLGELHPLCFILIGFNLVAWNSCSILNFDFFRPELQERQSSVNLLRYSWMHFVNLFWKGS